MQYGTLISGIYSLQGQGLVKGRCVCSDMPAEYAFLCIRFNTRYCCFPRGDYSLASTSVMFDTAGTQTAVFPVYIVDDTDADRDRIFTLTLDTVAGQGAVLGSPSEITITILENGRVLGIAECYYNHCT